MRLFFGEVTRTDWVGVWFEGMKNQEGTHTSMVESSGALSQTNLSHLPKCREMVTATIIFQIVSATWKEDPRRDELQADPKKKNSMSQP